MVMEMNVLFFFGVYGLGPLQSSSGFNFETMTTSTEDLLLITKPVPIDTSGKYIHRVGFEPMILVIERSKILQSRVK
jgi:hypothetical protein